MGRWILSLHQHIHYEENRFLKQQQLLKIILLLHQLIHYKENIFPETKSTLKNCKTCKATY